MTDGRSRIARVQLVLGLVVSLWLPQAGGATEQEAVAIARILTDPGAFNLEIVTLVGTIRDIRATGGSGECGPDPGFILYLRDETGELPIRHQGTCAQDGLLSPISGRYARGERVVVRAAIIEHPDRQAESSPLEATLVRIDRASD